MIGRPWEDPAPRRHRDGVLAGELADDEELPLDGDGDGDGTVDDEPVDQVGETVLLGPDGIDDPETEWKFDDTGAPLPELSDDEIWLLVPGEALQVVTNLPKARHLPLGLAVRPGEIAVCTGRRRRWSRTPDGGSHDDADLPMAQRVVVVFIRHRASGVRTKPRKYVIVTDAEGDVLGWLDYSDAWNFEGQILKEMVTAAGLDYDVERHTTESEFESQHPDWVR